MPDTEILLVEDDALNQALVPAILARSAEPRLRDAHVTVAGTLERAREVIAGQRIDLVLLDMRLPDGSGLPLVAELRRAGTPVIALTGAPYEHRDAALAAGCVAVLGKPYSLAELREVVVTHLNAGEPQAAPPDGAVTMSGAAMAQAPGGAGPAATDEYLVALEEGPMAVADAPVAAANVPEPPAAGFDVPAARAEAPVGRGAEAPATEAEAPVGRAAEAPAVMAENPAPGPDQAGPAPEADFGLLFAAVPGRYLALDPELRIVAVSDAYAQATRASSAGLVGRSLWQVLPQDADTAPPGALDSLRASLDRVCREKVADVMEVQKRFLPPPDAGRGTYEARYFQPANIPVLGPGGQLRYIIHALDDVTEHMADLDQAQQAARAAEAAKTQYVSRVSHELRSPVNTILGFGELLSLGDLTAEHREWATMMVKAARHLTAFLDDIADISRAQTQMLTLSIEPVQVSSVIGDALELIRPMAASHGVHLDPPPPASQHVHADQRRLRQVLLNLLSNAVKYNHPAGRVTITVEPRLDGRLRISICDTGRGIADYDIGQLFSPFQRLDAAQAGIEGAGLGLTLSRQLVEAMGGTIGATSAPGEGSVFWVELPMAQPAAAAGAVTGADPVVEPRAYTTPKTILYVEDMLETLLLVEHILGRRPSTSVVPAMLGGVALDLAAECRPHLILLDLNLPDIPGIELLRRLKADPATSATPVVIISADASGERIDSLLAAGAAAYLTKPISVRDFLHTIDALLAAPPPAAAADAGQAEQEPVPEEQPERPPPGL